MKQKSFSKLIIGLAFCMASLMIASCAKDIVDVNGSIKGIVKDQETGSLIANCQVSLSPAGKSIITETDGAFAFEGLEPGSYTLSFKKAGYEDASRTVSVTSGETSQLSIALKSKSAFALSENKLDFGDLSSSLSFYMFNNSDQTSSFTIKNIPSWATFSHTAGNVSPNNTTTITVSVNRDAVDYGTYTQIVSIDYSGRTSGTVTLTLEMKKVQLTSPTVEIAAAAENVTKNSFSIGGTVQATGGAVVTSYGHCWSLTENPTIDASKTDIGSTKDIVDFKSEIKDLNPGATYYVRAYAINQYGVGYSKQVIVTTQDVESNKWDGNIATSFAGGDGTAGNPYKVTTGGQLLLMKDYNNAYFVLEGNIDLNNHNWLPFEFRGNLDGAGYVISNLYIKRTDDYQGLFSTLTGTVKNMTIKGVNIEGSGYSYIGALAGTITGGSGTGKANVNNISIILTENSNILGKDNIGGLAGSTSDEYGNEHVLIENCSISSVSSTSYFINGNDNVGGVIGSNSEVSLSNLKASINVLGNNNVGGIIGRVGARSSHPISFCYYRGIIKGSENVGGITGYNHTSENISYFGCHSKTQIEGESGVGGLLGCSDSEKPALIACYSEGIIKGTNYFGGLSGKSSYSYSYPDAYLCYSTMSSTSSNFDAFGKVNCTDCATTSANTNASLTNSLTNCTDITSHLKSAYSEYAKYWNFDSTWTWTGEINGTQCNVSCPKLAWE